MIWCVLLTGGQRQRLDISWTRQTGGRRAIGQDAGARDFWLGGDRHRRRLLGLLPSPAKLGCARGQRHCRVVWIWDLGPDFLSALAPLDFIHHHLSIMGWLNKVFGASKDDKRPPTSPTSGSSRPKPKPKPTSASGTSTPAAGSHSRSESRTGGNANAANAAPMSEFMASAMAAADAGMTWENQGGYASGARTPRPERVIDETRALSSLTDQEIARLTEGIQADVLKQVSSGKGISS